MNEYEAQAYIDSHLPGIPHHYHTNSNIHLNEDITDMADFMKRKFAENDWTTVKKVFNVAEALYNRGNSPVRSGVQNVFIYSISAIMPAERETRKRLQAIIPITLFSMYVQQILHSNI